MYLFVLGAWQGNQCKRFLGLISKKERPRSWRDVLHLLTTTVNNNNNEWTSEKKKEVIDFIDTVMKRLITKLTEVIIFISRIEPMQDPEIEAGCQVCEEYVQMYRELMGVGEKHPILKENISITPKMHILEVHVPEFVREFGTVGFFGEDVIETLHKDYNSMIRRYSSVRRVEDQMQVMDDYKNLKFIHGE